ncbi:MAG: MFS transporter [Hyphomicrobiaceae bacterium]
MSTTHAEASQHAHAVTEAAPRRALVGWVLFDFAAQPFYTLILTFLFAPYFATVVVGDAMRGQAIWGYAAAVSGVLVGIGSPFLGAVADGGGRRKPWIALFAVILIAAMSGLWLAKPGTTGAMLWLVVLCFVIATIAAEFASVFINAIMPTLVPPSSIGRLSGIGWGVGYAGGLLALLLMAGFITADPGSGKTLLGLDPVLKLDTASREGDRLIGPFSAAWFALFVLPFFLFVPDSRPVQAADAAKVSPGAALLATLKDLPSHPDMLKFLVARAIYVDGLTAIFTFGGVYGAKVFGWQAFELGLFGIILTLTGAIGAIIGGFLDDRLGSRNLILAALVLLLIGALGILSVTGTHVFYGMEVAPKAAGSKIFASVGEQVFLAFAMLVGVVAAPVQAASRSLLAHLAPPDKMTQFFGLFAFSGKVTAFMAPLLIALVTDIFQSQRAGMSVIAGFLIVGFLIMLGVRQRRAA